MGVGLDLTFDITAVTRSILIQGTRRIVNLVSVQILRKFPSPKMAYMVENWLKTIQ